MFVNKLPFLITVSHGLCFETIVEALLNHVTDGLNWVVQIYHCLGFQITMALADPEFEPLQASFGDISFNFCAQDEHIPEIKCYICMAKAWTQSGYNLLPLEQIPCLMLICLVTNVVFWLNAFLSSDGASNSLSPCYLLTGKHLDYQKHICLKFGGYIQMHEEHTNNMMP